MKLRLLCVFAMLFAFAGAAQAADAGKKDAASDNGLKNLTIPSVEMGGGSIGVSTDKPNDPNVPAFHDPTVDDRKAQPFVGLKFTKPLTGK
jgi:hypothetical protein